MITADGCIVVKPADGKSATGAAGTPTLIKATAEETSGLLEVFEQTAAPGTGPPLHIHHECSESFFVIAGALRFRLGAETVEVGPGAFAFVSKGTPHTYLNVGATEARVLFWFTPAGRMAGYFSEIARAGSVNRATLNEIATRHAVEIVESP